MKIVLPVHHFPPRYSAGAELYTFRLARWLQQQGHQAEVVAVESIEEGSTGQLTVSADEYEGIPVQRLTFNLIEAAERRRWDYDNDLLGDWFGDYLLQSQPDLVHFQAGYLIGAAPLHTTNRLGFPMALTLHDYWFLCPRLTLQRSDGTLCTTMPENPADCAWCRRAEQRPYQLADQLSIGLAGRTARKIALHSDRQIISERRDTVLPSLKLPDVVIAPSHFLANQYAPFVPADNLVVSRYGLDLAPFRTPTRRAAGGPLRIGFTGQMAHHKGVHVLIEAFTRLKEGNRPIELHLYGGLEAFPAYVSKLRRLAGEDPRIHFHGRFENRRAAEIVGGFDLAVVPSIWYENSPLAIMEAQAAGTPVVTSALGGMSELVRDGVDGALFRAGDATDLARQLQRVIDDPDMLLSLRAGIVTPRSIDDEMQQLLGIYENLIARHSIAIAVQGD